MKHLKPSADLAGSYRESRISIAILMTCFNRCSLTLEALRAIYASQGLHGIDLEIFLVDDGSIDGTGEAVRAAFPDVHVVLGNGKLYWNGGMRLAWLTALDKPHDFYLWLNDDLSLFPGAIRELLEAWNQKYQEFDSKLIIVGRTTSPSSGLTTYGGLVHAKGISRLRFDRPIATGIRCDTMNGNCVLIPTISVEEIGINSPFYTHAYGDIDYGLRATGASFTILEHEKPVGLQEYNVGYAKQIGQLTIKNAKFILFDPKGVSLKEWFNFCRDHGGPIWPINFVWRYVRLLLAR